MSVKFVAKVVQVTQNVNHCRDLWHFLGQNNPTPESPAARITM